MRHAYTRTVAPFIAGLALFVGLLWFATVAFRDIRRDQIEEQYGTRPNEPPGFLVRLIRSLAVGGLAIAVALASIGELLSGIDADYNGAAVIAGLIAAAALASAALWILFSKAAQLPVINTSHAEPADGSHRHSVPSDRSRGLALLGAAVLLALLDGWVGGIGGGYDPGLTYLALLAAGGLTIWGLRLVLRT